MSNSERLFTATKFESYPLEVFVSTKSKFMLKWIQGILVTNKGVYKSVFYVNLLVKLSTFKANSIYLPPLPNFTTMQFSNNFLSKGFFQNAKLAVFWINILQEQQKEFKSLVVYYKEKKVSNSISVFDLLANNLHLQCSNQDCPST